MVVGDEDEVVQSNVRSWIDSVMQGRSSQNVEMEGSLQMVKHSEVVCKRNH